jgi:hypothetical protein
MTDFNALALAAAARKRRQAQAPQTPEGMFFNPETGQYTSRELLASQFEPQRGGAFVRGGATGASFGLLDEIAGGLGYLSGGEDLGTFKREKARAMMEADERDFPGTALAGQVTGALAPAAASAPLAMGKGLIGTIGRGIGIGATEGAMHGAGGGEGVEDRVNQAAWGAGVGGVVGGAAPLAIAGVKSVADPIVGAIMRRPSQPKVYRAIADALMKSGKTADGVAKELSEASLEGQGEFRLMDALGQAGQRRASGVVRSGGEGAEELADFLQRRQMGQPERVSGFVEEAFGLPAQPRQASGTAVSIPGQASPDQPADVLSRRIQSASQLTDDLTKARGEAANMAYDAARGNAAPVDVRGALSVIDNRIGGMQGSGVAGDGIDSKLLSYRNRLAAPESALEEGVSARELSDFDRVLGLKQTVQDDIGAAVRAGRNNEARELGKLVRELDQALEAASPSYRAANDQFRSASGVIEAVGEGANMSRPGMRATDSVAQFSGMTPDQQAAARAGYADRVLSQIEASAAPTTNRAKPLQSPKRTAEAQSMTLDPELYARRLARENSMWETQNRALGGSRTADNLADVDGIGSATSGVMDVARSLGNLNLGDAVAKAGAALGPIMRGENDATRRAIAEALMSSDAQATLAPAVRKVMGDNLRESIAAALMRQPGRERLLDLGAR